MFSVSAVRQSEPLTFLLSRAGKFTLQEAAAIFTPDGPQRLYCTCCDTCGLVLCYMQSLHTHRHTRTHTHAHTHTHTYSQTHLYRCACLCLHVSRIHICSVCSSDTHTHTCREIQAHKHTQDKRLVSKHGLYWNVMLVFYSASSFTINVVILLRPLTIKNPQFYKQTRSTSLENGTLHFVIHTWWTLGVAH